MCVCACCEWRVACHRVKIIFCFYFRCNCVRRMHFHRRMNAMQFMIWSWAESWWKLKTPQIVKEKNETHELLDWVRCLAETIFVFFFDYLTIRWMREIFRLAEHNLGQFNSSDKWLWLPMRIECSTKWLSPKSKWTFGITIEWEGLSGLTLLIRIWNSCAFRCFGAFEKGHSLAFDCHRAVSHLEGWKLEIQLDRINEVLLFIKWENP